LAKDASVITKKEKRKKIMNEKKQKNVLKGKIPPPKKPRKNLKKVMSTGGISKVFRKGGKV
jgi:hypothetical protein